MQLKGFSTSDIDLPHLAHEHLNCHTLYGSGWKSYRQVGSSQFCHALCDNFSFLSPYVYSKKGTNYSAGNGSSSEQISSGDISFVFTPLVPKWYETYVLNILGTFHLLFSIWMVVEYFVLNKLNIRFYSIELLV